MDEYGHILYQPSIVARIILNRPQFRNAQGRRMIEELDDAFARAKDDPQVRVVIFSGAGTSFSAGHDLGTPEELEDPRSWMGPPDRFDRYVRERELWVESALRWRNVPKPTIAMVHGYCIYGGWILAAAMDIVFAASTALFLPSNLQYFSAPWDIGPKKAKEILFEGRFIRAKEAQELGFVNRVFPPEELEGETLAYAERVASRGPVTPRMTKFLVNNTLDQIGYTASVEAAFQTYAINGYPETPPKERREAARRAGAEGGETTAGAERRQAGGVSYSLDLLRQGIPPES